MGKDFVITEGKSLEEAIQEGLKKLNKKKKEVDVEVLNEGKSIMGLFKKKYKVKLTPKKDESEASEEELDKVLEQLNKFGDKNSSFEFKYLNDGVHVVVNRCVSSDEILLKRITNRIKRKNIQDFDLNAVVFAIKESNGEPIKIAPPQREEMKNSEVDLEITDDGLKAYMTLLPPLGGNDLNFQEAMDTIKESITVGILDEEIQKIIVNRIYNKKTLIAKGKESVDGIDGTIDYKFDLDKSTKKVRLMDDGSVDFRNLNLITNVNEGDVLAVMTTPTKGENGITVTGKMIKGQDGKQVMLKYGKGVKLSSDSKTLIAERDGQVTLDGDKVNVREVYNINANVDNSTGNVEFNGMVSIKGNVRTGFKVKAEGDIEVNGVVEASEIESESNIVLKRGMQGHNKGKLTAQGDIVAKYLENTYLYAGGCIKAEAIMHSQVYSQDTIEIGGKKGLLVGGTCKAKHEIHARTIGSTMATSTELEVGVDPNIKSQYETIKSEIEDTEANIEKLNKSITLLNRLAKNDQLTKDKKQLLIKCLNDRNTLSNNTNELKEDIIEIEKQMEKLSKGKIYIRDTIYPGVKITIGKSVMFVKKEFKHCTIYLSDGEIKIGPYEG